MIRKIMVEIEDMGIFWTASAGYLMDCFGQMPGIGRLATAVIKVMCAVSFTGKCIHIALAILKG